MAETLRSVLFVDFDNVFFALQSADKDAARAFANDPQSWLDAIESGVLIEEADGSERIRRRILMRRCYANPAVMRYFRPSFTRSGFQIVDCPPLTGKGKNSADIYMVVDMLDAMRHETRFDEFIILSGDADFTPVLTRLRAYDRRSVIYSNAVTAAAYKALCDGMITEERLIDLTGFGDDDYERPPEPARAEPAKPEPARAEPLRADAAPARPERIRSEPMRAEAARAEPVRNGPTRSDRREAARDLTAPRDPLLPPARRQDPLRPRPGVYEAAPDDGSETERGTAGEIHGGGIPRGSLPEGSLAGGVSQDGIPQTGAAESGAAEAGAGRESGSEAARRMDDIEGVARRVSAATSVPAFAPEVYAQLFRALAAEVAERGFSLNRTVNGVMRRLSEHGLKLRPQSVAFVVKGLMLSGHEFAAGDKPGSLAKAFRRQVLYLAANADLVLADAERAMVGAWIVGALRAGPPGEAVEPEPLPGDQERAAEAAGITIEETLHPLPRHARAERSEAEREVDPDGAPDYEPDEADEPEDDSDPDEDDPEDGEEADDDGSDRDDETDDDDGGDEDASGPGESAPSSSAAAGLEREAPAPAPVRKVSIEDLLARMRTPRGS
ncbi:NYN domain-containing protein [Prosthecodimorpha staleyi]|uniref:NYN domain-containing protein n=1 Tax=Prosthecodimorpha staleyi TaxID=2840188 RepID=A0A947D664_9HYPH|nr:NYN domain-containing protein [Prosthecodimorpha staleyi]MBT9291068.1 NYN domain-containing protein [Prosthecodimorpha staleyi]